MPSIEKITRLGIFLATGYLCAGIIVAIFVGLPLWVNFFSSEFYIGALITVVTMLVAAVIGVLLMRALVSRYGLKPIFDMDVLVLMIGVLFLALSMNQAMVVVGLLVTIGAGTLYFIENFSVQMKAASSGGTKALTLAGWALGPIIAVAALTIFSQYGMLTLRILLAHYIVIAFWVWVQRLSLHEDYAEAPEFLHRLFETYQRASAIRAEQDLELKKNRFAKLYSPLNADKVKSTPKREKAEVETEAPKAEPKTEAKTEVHDEGLGLSVASVLANDTPKEQKAQETEVEAPQAEEAKTEEAQIETPAAPEPKAETEAVSVAEPQVETPKAEEPQVEVEAPKAKEAPESESKDEEAPVADKAQAAKPKKGFFWHK